MIRDRTEVRAEGNKPRPTEPPRFTITFKKHDITKWMQRQKSAASSAKPHCRKTE